MHKQLALKTLSTEHTNRILETLFPHSNRYKKEGLEPERRRRIRHILADEDVTPSITRNTI